MKATEIKSLIETPDCGEIPVGISAMRDQEPSIDGDPMMGARIRDGNIGLFDRRDAGVSIGSSHRPRCRLPEQP
jgi:hypothetical protein